MTNSEFEQRVKELPASITTFTGYIHSDSSKDHCAAVGWKRHLQPSRQSYATPRCCASPNLLSQGCSWAPRAAPASCSPRPKKVHLLFEAWKQLPKYPPANNTCTERYTPRKPSPWASLSTLRSRAC